MILDVEFEELNSSFEADFGEVLVIQPGDKTYADGLADGEAVGREKCWNEYWDTKQQNGKRVDYSSAFAYEEFKAEQFCPKYDIVPRTAFAMFGYSTINTPIIMSEWEKQNGIVFDTSYCNNFSQMFRDSNVFQEINVLDASGANTSSSMNLAVMFFGNKTIQRINRFICSEKTTFATTTFNSCTALEYIGFEGEITSANTDLSWSPLNKDCFQKLLSVLSATATGLTITLSKTAVANAFETAEGLADGVTSDEWLALVAARSNWTINLK